MDRPSGQAPYIIYVVPLFQSNLQTTFSYLPDLNDRAVAVFINDTSNSQLPDSERLQQLYPITRAEARLLGEFMESVNLKIAADRLGITAETARSYLKSVFNKLNVSSQSELVRRVLQDTSAITRTGQPAD